MSPSASSWYGPSPLGPADAVREAERILRDRASQYAEIAAVSVPEIDVLVLTLRGRQFALETRVLGPIQQATRLGAVPSTPPFVAGLLNFHGEVITVLDLAPLIGLGEKSEARERYLVTMIDLPSMHVGLLVDDVLGMQRIATHELTASPSGGEFQLEAADRNITLLDIERLLADDRFGAAVEAE